MFSVYCPVSVPLSVLISFDVSDPQATKESTIKAANIRFRIFLIPASPMSTRYKGTAKILEFL